MIKYIYKIGKNMRHFLLFLYSAFFLQPIVFADEYTFFELHRLKEERRLALQEDDSEKFKAISSQIQNYLNATIANKSFEELTRLRSEAVMARDWLLVAEIDFYCDWLNR